MSETTEAAPAQPTEALQPVAVEPAATAAPETQPPPQAAEPTAEATPEPKPTPAERRFAILTSRLATEAEARAAAERRAEAAEALLNAGKEKPAAIPTQPGETVEQAAERIVAQRDYDSRRNALVAAGEKELGKEAWAEKTGFLHDLGATGNQAFMQAIVAVPGATKLVAHLADDPDALATLLTKPPVAMAAEMGRMAAELTRPTPRPLSNAPRPATPVQAAAVVAEPDAYDEKLSMSEYVALRRKTAPRHLGGQGRPA